MAVREGRGARRRGLLLVTGVAVGVGALVAINSFTDTLRRSVQSEARALLGADLALASSAPFTDGAEATIAEIRRAASTPARPARIARVVSFGAMVLIPGGETTRLVQVVAVDPGHPFYGEIETSPVGEWARLAVTGGAIVDPALLVSLRAKLGDTLALGEARFRIRATVENMPGDVGVRTAFGPRVFIARDRVESTGLLTQGARARHEVYLALPPAVDAERLAQRFRSRLAAERVSVRTVAEDQRRLNETLTRLGNYLGLIALVALLLGGLGVASAVHVFIKRRLESVAILRCLGASGGIVLMVYLLQAAAVGLVGSLAGAGLGIVVQLALPRLLRDLLPVGVGWAVSWPAILGGIGVGLWVAVAFALLPLLAVRRVSPLAALRRDYEEPRERRRRDLPRVLAGVALAATVGALAIIQAGQLVAGLAFAAGIATALGVLWLAAVLLVRGLRRHFPTRLPYLWRQGLANLYRPANQTLMVVLALGFGAFLLATVLLVQHNLLRDLRVDRRADRPNVVFFDVQKDQLGDVEARLTAVAPLVGAAVPIVPMRIQSLKGRSATQMLGEEGDGARRGRWAIRREYRSSFRDAPREADRIVAGSWWRPGEWKGRAADGPVPIAVDSGLARELEVGLGDEVVWDVQGLPVASRVVCLRDVDWARFEPNFFVLFPEGPLDAAPQSYVLLSRVEDTSRRARLQRDVVEAHPNVSSLDLAQVQRAVEGILDRVALAIRFMALFSLAAGAVVLMGAVAASRFQRVREGALLRTLGATRSQLLRILVAEYAVLGVLASGTAIGLSSIAGFALVHFAFKGRFTLPGPSLLALVLAVVALTVAVGLSGSTEVWRRPPLEVLREE
jgi:putative ABC transport system permease protein